MSPERIQTKIDASPTKDFFIDMLVKDVTLIPVIIDLVDNCVDGVLRNRGGDFKGLWVRIETKKDSFKIADNCGGIPVQLAEKYAFRFGRPKNAPSVEHSIGEYGIGMKRALFKLGKEFVIESTTVDSHFVVGENVDTWRKNDRWEFTFSERKEGKGRYPQNKTGTIITVKRLYDSVSSDFQLEDWRNKLIKELKDTHQNTMEKGLEIFVNGIPVEGYSLEMLASSDIRPALKEVEFEGEDQAKVSVKMYAGIGESEPGKAGWNVYCNGRLILRADQSNITGWGELSTPIMPKYHNQFARFRGYVFFDCEDPGRLPWNTSKTSVDQDSEIFRTVRRDMLTLMRPVIDFLNKLDAEKEAEHDDTPLTDAMKEVRGTNLVRITPSVPFRYPSKSRKPTPRTGRIRYERLEKDIEKVKEVLGVSSNKEVGIKTFEYFLEAECDK